MNARKPLPSQTSSSSNLRTRKPVTGASSSSLTTTNGASTVKRNRLTNLSDSRNNQSVRTRPQAHGRNSSVNASSSTSSILKPINEGTTSSRATPRVRGRNNDGGVTFGKSATGSNKNTNATSNGPSAKSSFSGAADIMNKSDSVFNQSLQSPARTTGMMMTASSGATERKDSRMLEINQLKGKNRKLQDENERLKAAIKESDDFRIVLDKDFPFERYDEKRYFLLKAQLRQQTRQIRMLNDQLTIQKKLYYETDAVIHKLCHIESDLSTKEQHLRDEFVKLIAEKSTEKKKREVGSLNNSRSSDGEETKTVNLLEECRKKLNEMKRKLNELEMISREEFSCALNRSNPFINPGELEYYTNILPDVRMDLNKGKVLNVETNLARLLRLLVSVQAQITRGELPHPDQMLETSAQIRESAEAMLLLGIPLEEPINNEVYSQGCSAMDDIGRRPFLPEKVVSQLLRCIDRRENKKKVKAFLEHLKVLDRKMQSEESLRTSEINLYKMALEHSSGHVDRLSKFVNRKLMLIDEHFKANIYEKFKDLYLIHKKAKMNDYGVDYYSELFTTFGLYAEDMNEAFLKSLGSTPSMDFDLDSFQNEFENLKEKVNESLLSWNSFVNSFQLEEQSQEA
mmetsp:Transcript_49961/g.57335  ORF Transcript_49961/g.57335 Transcript_49961/m.57335 type:complete len:628 (-) Transcript_49961:197-2080(-)